MIYADLIGNYKNMRIKSLVDNNVEGTGIHASNGLGRKTPWTYYYNGGKGRKEYRTTRGQKPQPFLSKSLEKNKDKIIQILTE